MRKNILLSVIAASLVFTVGCVTHKKQETTLHTTGKVNSRTMRIAGIDGQSVDANQSKVVVIPGAHDLTIIDDAQHRITMSVYIGPGKTFALEDVSVDLNIIEGVMSLKYD